MRQRNGNGAPQQHPDHPAQWHRRRRSYASVGLILPIVLVGLFVLVPFIYLMAAGGRGAHVQTTTTATTTALPVTTTTSTTIIPTTATMTTTGLVTTTTIPSTTTTATTATTTATTTTATTTTVPITTTPAFTSCAQCTDNATLPQGSACASQYATCLNNDYNCPVLCHGTFKLNGVVPTTCTNGFIPEWPPLQTCLCQAMGAGCDQLCSVNCGITTTSGPQTPTPAPAVCTGCFDTQTGPSGPCFAQYTACTSNPSSPCALLCAPYYRINVPVFPSCTDTLVIPEWEPLATCLCPTCSNNVTCTANQC